MDTGTYPDVIDALWVGRSSRFLCRIENPQPITFTPLRRHKVSLLLRSLTAPWISKRLFSRADKEIYVSHKLCRQALRYEDNE